MRSKIFLLLVRDEPHSLTEDYVAFQHHQIVTGDVESHDAQVCIAVRSS